MLESENSDVVQTYPLESEKACCHDHPSMFLRSHSRSKVGKAHVDWSLVETVHTPDDPRQRTICYLGELNSSAEARRLKTVDVFNEQGEARQLKRVPSHVVPPDDDPEVARVVVNKVRLEWTRGFGCCFLGLDS
jgi:hypothetical protein